MELNYFKQSGRKQCSAYLSGKVREKYMHGQPGAPDESERQKN